MSTIPQLASLRTRLNQLEHKKAIYGISADPSISIEANDLATVVQQMEMIDIHRRNLDTLLKQRGSHGNNTPISIANQIISERANVARLRQVVARLGQNVPAHPVDDDEPTIEAPPIQRPARPERMTTGQLREKLDQIQQIIDEIRTSL